MWLVTQIGFFSIVEKPHNRDTGTLTIRARKKEDLENLRTKYLPDLSPTQFDPRADYAYRASAPRERVQDAVSALVADIRYDNFKDQVAKVQGNERAILYHQVWAALARLQQRRVPPDIPTFYASIGNRPDILDSDDLDE